MEVLVERAAGLDVHRSIIVACVLVQTNGRTRKERSEFRATPGGLEQLESFPITLRHIRRD